MPEIKNTNLASYGTYTVDEAAKEEKEIAESASVGSFLKMEPGRNVVRFLPPKPGVARIFTVVWEHFVKHPGMTKAVRFTCPQVMERKPCPACAEADRLKRTRNPVDAEAADDLYPRRRVYASVISRKEPEKGPQILAFGMTIHKALVTIRNDEDGGDFSHPVEGFDIAIDKSGDKLNTRYIVMPSRKTIPLHPDMRQAQQWIDDQPDLSLLARILEESDIKEKLGQEATDAEFTEGGAAPAAAGPTASSTVDDGFGEPQF